MFKQLSKQRSKFASQMGLKGLVKPGSLMDRAEEINTGKVKLPKKIKIDHLKKAEKYLLNAERHLKMHHN